MKFNTNKILAEWAYRVDDGQPDVTNVNHINHLREILYNFGLPHKFIVEYVHGLTEDSIVKNKKSGSVYPVKKVNPATQQVIKKNASKKDLEKLDKNKDSGKEDKPKTDSETLNIVKLMDGANGIDKKITSSLKKYPNTFGKTQQAKVKALHNDFKAFLTNPSQESAQAIVDTYKLSTNEGGNKLYLGFVIGNGRKALGKGKLTKGMVSAIEKHLPGFKQQGDPIKAAKQAVTTTSKPDISGAPSDDTPITFVNKKGQEETISAGKAKKRPRNHPAKNAYLKQTSIATADNDPIVKEIFTRDPFDYLESSMHEVFGPKDKNGRLKPNQGGKNAKSYFDQSIENNTALKATMSKLEELEKAGTANPLVRESLQEHENELKRISENFTNMAPEDRQKAVENSYAKMAQKMSQADPEMTNAIFKNVAEMALYDSEIAGGVEAYLPSAGTFPSGDKIRVDRDGNSKVEKIAAVSCKYGKSSSGTYGFPGESQQYIKFHPDEKKRDLMNNRVGAPGYALGVKDSVITDSTEFNQLLKESGVGSAFMEGGAEKVRSAMQDAQEKITKLVGPPPIKKDQLVSKAKKLKAINSEVIKALDESIDKNELQKIIGGKYDESTGKTAGNMSTFFEGGAHAASMIVFGAALATSNGLDVIEHHHQVIDDNGLQMETAQGSPSMRDWNLTHRMFDSRGGGIIAGSTGPGDRK